MGKLNLERLKTAKKYIFSYANTDVVDAEFVKSLRKKLNMTQIVFASVIGVAKKTVEKWEQGKNPVKGPTAKFLILLDKKPELIQEIYKVETKNYDINPKNQMFYIKSCDTNKNLSNFKTIDFESIMDNTWKINYSTNSVEVFKDDKEITAWINQAVV